MKASTATDPNYYPNTAINLSVLAYQKVPVIPGPEGIGTIPNMTCPWVAGNDTYQMFIAANSLTNEYWVVIRGTDPISMSAWFDEDFNINHAVLLNSINQWPPNISVPSDVIISEGAVNGINGLLALSDANGDSFLDYLQSNSSQIEKLYVTGHSLGGTLSPVMYCFLNACLYNGETTDDMGLWTFAGLTAGGVGFNDYFNALVPKSLVWRIQNSYDIAPFLFVTFALSSVEKIYMKLPTPLPIDPLAKKLLTGLFLESDLSGAVYQQPQKGIVMQGSFPGDGNPSSWPDGIMYQHHSTTYQAMVSTNFPLNNA